MHCGDQTESDPTNGRFPYSLAGALATLAYHHLRGRRESERPIEERIQARFQAIIEEAQDFFFLLDADGAITYTKR